jgi:hypothetical protein
MPLAFLAAPVCWLLFAALGPGMMSAIAFFAALCLLPLAPLLPGVRRRWFYPILLLAGVGLMATGLARSGFGVDEKKPNHVMYLLDRTPGTTPVPRARWISVDEVTDEWTGQFLGATPGRAPVPELARSQAMLESAAPVLDLPQPRVRVVDDAVTNGRHRTTLHVDTNANLITLQAEGESAVQVVRVGGTPVFDAADGQPFRRVQMVSPPAEGVDVRFDLPAGALLKLQVVQQFWGLPGQDAVPHARRADDMMMTPLRLADSRFTLDRWAP